MNKIEIKYDGIYTYDELIQHLKKIWGIKETFTKCVERGDNLSSLQKEGIILEKLK